MRGRFEAVNPAYSGTHKGAKDHLPPRPSQLPQVLIDPGVEGNTAKARMGAILLGAHRHRDADAVGGDDLRVLARPRRHWLGLTLARSDFQHDP